MQTACATGRMDPVWSHYVRLTFPKRFPHHPHTDGRFEESPV